MFYLVKKPNCSLEALWTESTSPRDLQLVASAFRRPMPGQDIWDYTEWRLFADHYPIRSEVLAYCSKLADPGQAEFVFVRRHLNLDHFDPFIVAGKGELVAIKEGTEESAQAYAMVQ